MIWTDELKQRNFELYGNQWGLTQEEIEGLTLSDFHESLHIFTLDYLLRRLSMPSYDFATDDIAIEAFRTNIALEPYFNRIAPLVAQDPTAIDRVPAQPPMHVSPTFDWTTNQWCVDGGRNRIRTWVLEQLKGRYPSWNCPFPVCLYVDGTPVLVLNGVWQAQKTSDNLLYVGLKSTGYRNRAFEISVTMGIATIFGLQNDEEILRALEFAIASMFSGVVESLVTPMINTHGNVTAIAMNESQMAVELNGVWRAPNGAIQDVAGWVTFPYYQ